VASREGDDLTAQVWQIANRHCIMCHAGERASKGLSLESPAALLKARPGVVVWGDPEESELYRRVTGASAPRMPMTGPPWLSDDEIATIRQWIARGEPSATALNAPVDLPASAATAVVADPASIAEPTFAHVGPLLAMNCVRCHAPQGIMGAAPEGLVLTDLPNVTGSGERAVVIPGNPEASLLLRHVTGRELPRMPMDGPPFLSPAEIDLVGRWIAQGARDEKGVRSPLPVGREIRVRGVLQDDGTVDGVSFTRTGAEVRDAGVGRVVELRAVVEPDGSLRATRLRGR
jgi:mono/diheme cytochrome c family protein